MSRWQPNARERLQIAARELFVRQGFAATTVPEIAARAELTTRTFFRHFADKREVVFEGNEIPRLAARLVAEAPEDWAPMTVLREALPALGAARFDGRREPIAVMRAVVRSDPGLIERDLQKRADLVAAVRAGFSARGLPPAEAALVAEVAVAVVQVALEEWLDDTEGRSFAAVAGGCFERMGRLLDAA